MLEERSRNAYQYMIYRFNRILKSCMEENIYYIKMFFFIYKFIYKITMIK